MVDPIAIAIIKIAMSCLWNQRSVDDCTAAIHVVHVLNVFRWSRRDHPFDLHFVFSIFVSR